jgi:TrmH family RNA methyltransferase
MDAISSRRNSLVKTFRALARSRSDERLLLDGVRLVEDAVETGLTLEVVAVSSRLAEPSQAGVDRLTASLAGAPTRVVRVTPAVMAAMSPVRTPSGVVAIAERPAPSLDRAFEDARPLVFVLVGLQDPGNVGAVIRGAVAAGATGLVTCEQTADPYGWKALRGAMGATFRIPVAAGHPAARAVAAARLHGLRVVATQPRGGRGLYEADLSGPLAVLVGGEAWGLETEIQQLADERLSIPMCGSVESLNAAVSAALVAYEAYRQRHAGGRVGID